MTTSIEPWTLKLCASYTERPSAYVLDARGEIIGVFRDYRDAEQLFVRIQKLEETINDLETINHDLEEQLP